jgi:hypothetical protein
MTLPASGQISLNDINVETGRTGTTANTSLTNMSNGTTITINTANAAADRPDGATPHSMSEWYSYDHDLVTTSWSNVPADFTMSGSDGATVVSALKTITLTGGSGNTSVDKTISGGAVVTLQIRMSTSGDPGTSGTWLTLGPQTIAHTSGTLYMRFRAIHSAAKDGTGAANITFTNNGVTNSDLDITFFFSGGGGFP